MAAGNQKRTRSERVAAFELPPGRWERAWANLRQRDVLLRIGLALAAAAFLCLVIGGWDPPFPFREGDVPARDLTARVEFLALAVDGQSPERYPLGSKLAEAGERLSTDQVELLRREHVAFSARRVIGDRMNRSLGAILIFAGMFALGGFYLHYREPRVLVRLQRLVTLLALVLATVVTARWVGSGPWRVEIVLVVLFGQMLALVYQRELALVFTGAVGLVLGMAMGLSLAGILLPVGTAGVAVLQLSRVRHRSKLIQVGLYASGAALMLTLAGALWENQPVDDVLLWTAGRNVMLTIVAGFLMTGLLPFIERKFGVLTDMSLLELGDLSNPLLQELVRRAPSTYNHSVMVGSIAEAAADAIGGRGLLVRVGAYYHDIGKMLKPEYFIENQPADENRHDGLIPAMSTLVIIAHIKDGADLARKHHLPEPLIDFIEQHHGTTLVEFFFGRAHQQSQDDPNAAEVDENTFRYPGPKPRTKESGVLMLADAAESACRSLVEPAPARIESLVRELTERKLHGGQFDETDLTLRELRSIQNSMIKSLLAHYHGRVKYPDQQTA